METRRSLGLALTLAVLSACSETPSELTVLDSSQVFASYQNTQVPFKGVVTFTHVIVPGPGPASDPGCVNTNAGAAPGEVWVPAATSSGDVNATHLGKSVISQNGCNEVSQASVGGPFKAIGEATLTAANGDQVFYTFDGVVHQGTFLADVDVVFTGGTGRFVGATGGFSASSSGNALALPVVYPFSGTISSVGSLK